MTSWPPSIETMVDDPAREELKDRKGRPVDLPEGWTQGQVGLVARVYEQEDFIDLLLAYFDLTRELRTNPERWRPDKQDNLDMLHRADELAETIQALRP